MKETAVAFYVPIFGELSHEHLVQFSLEHTVGAELTLFAHLGRHDDYNLGEEREGGKSCKLLVIIRAHLSTC